MSCPSETNVPLGKDNVPAQNVGPCCAVAWIRIGAGWGRREAEERPTGDRGPHRRGAAMMPELFRARPGYAELKAVEAPWPAHRSAAQGPPCSGVLSPTPALRGWANCFRIGNSGRCFGYARDWVEKKIRRHLTRARKRKCFGWNRWSRKWLYQAQRLYGDYQVRYYQKPKVLPTR